MSKKLYRVTCRGMKSGIAGSPTFGVSFVVAENPKDAYEVVRSALDRRDLGFDKDREMETVELIAEASDYPACGTILYA